MNFIKLYTGLIRHRKLIELAKDLKIKPVYAHAHLTTLWCSALEQAQDGDLSSWSDEFIAYSAHYEGDPVNFVKLLQKNGWLDDRILHDWLDYAGRYLMNRYGKSEKHVLENIWKKHDKLYGQPKANRFPTDSHPTPNQKPTTDKIRLDKSREEKKYVGGKSSRFTPPTLAELEIYCSERKNGVDPQKFLDFYESKGWLIGKNKMKDWKAAVRTWERSSGATGYLDPKNKEKPRINDSRSIPNEIKRLFSAVRVAKDLPKEIPGWDEAHFSKEGPAAQKLLEFCGGDVILAGRYIIDKGSELKALGLNWTLETILRHAYDSEDLAQKKENKHAERKQEQMGAHPISGGNANKENPRGGESEGTRSKSAEENRNRLNALVSGVVGKLPIPGHT